jgi:hypothetical protein
MSEAFDAVLALDRVNGRVPASPASTNARMASDRERSLLARHLSIAATVGDDSRTGMVSPKARPAAASAPGTSLPFKNVCF